MPTISTNGINIYYETRGKGEPLLVINGLAIDLSQVEGMIGALSEHCRVIAFDNRGAGRSDKPDSPYTIDAMAADAYALLNGLGVATASVLGISMGGKIALSLALEHPKAVRRLVLASTGARVQRPGIRWALTNALLRIPAVRAVGTKYPQPYYAYVRQREASGVYDAMGRLDEIRVPTLILHGKSDRTVPLAIAEELHKGITGSRLVTFDGGHLFFFKDREEFAKAVSQFANSEKE